MRIHLNKMKGVLLIRNLFDQILSSLFFYNYSIQQQDEFIKFANSAVADMSEYSIQEINKWSVKDFIKIIHAEDLPLIYAKVNLVNSDDFDSSEQFECRLITKSGSIKFLKL